MSSLLSVIENVPSASEISSPSKTLTVIIVLGCPPFQTTPNPNTSLTHRGELDATFVARVKKAAEVFYETPGRSVIIPTGYQAARYAESEAAAMRRLLLEQNISLDNIIIEEEADSTVQNAIKTRHLVRNLMRTSNVVNVVIVTSSFHMKRSRYIFSRLFQCDQFQLHFEAADNNVSQSELQYLLEVEEICIDRLEQHRHRILEEAARETF
ncbi:hypothetical protein ACHWQZ_G014502 [Mnemiopsis leidyi]